MDELAPRGITDLTSRLNSVNTQLSSREAQNLKLSAELHQSHKIAASWASCQGQVERKMRAVQL
jgi:hypothetical protein